MTSAAQAAAAAREGAPYPWLSRYPDGVDWFQKFSPVSLGQLLDTAVAKYGNKACTNFLGRTLTYGEIGQLVERTAAGLQRLGVKRGTKVGLFMPNCPTFIIYYFATLKAGATIVNYNPLYTLEELTFQVKDSETQLMVTLDLKVLFDKVEGLLKAGTLGQAVVASFPALLPSAKSVLFKLFRGRELANPGKSPIAGKIVADVDVLAGGTGFQKVPIEPMNDIAVLQYTGGTTGTPKGAMLTHANLTVNCQQGAAWATNLNSGQERTLAVLPFFHVFAMTAVMNFALQEGAEIVMMPRFVLDDALKLIDKTKPTVMPGVPTMFIAMLNHPKLDSFDLSSLKYCLSGGAPLPIDVKERFEEVTGCKVVEAYGLSEASPGVTCNPVEGPVKGGSIGQPLPGTVVSLRDLADPTREVALGEKGEILRQGPPGHERLLEETGGDGQPVRRRFPAHGRCGHHGRGGVHLHRRPHQGPDHLLGLQRLPAQHRGGDLSASSRRGGHRHRHQGYLSRRGSQGLHQAEGGGRGDRGRHPRPPGEQAVENRDAGADRVPRRASQDDDRQALQEGAESRGGGAAEGRLRSARTAIGSMQFSAATEEGNRLYAIGELADEFNVTTRTIRFYESKGLISPARRGVARAYSRRDRARLKLILRGKNLGFSLEEIAEYLKLYDADPAQIAQTQMLLSRVEQAIDKLQAKRADLDRTIKDLKEIRAQCVEHLRNKGAGRPGRE